MIILFNCGHRQVHDVRQRGRGGAGCGAEASAMICSLGHPVIPNEPPGPRQASRVQSVISTASDLLRASARSAILRANTQRRVTTALTILLSLERVVGTGRSKPWTISGCRVGTG